MVVVLLTFKAAHNVLEWVVVVLPGHKLEAFLIKLGMFVVENTGRALVPVAGGTKKCDTFYGGLNCAVAESKHGRTSVKFKVKSILFKIGIG